MFERIIEFIRSLYPGKEIIPLHEPHFDEKEKKYVTAAIDSTYVSSVGEYVNRFEEMLCDITGSIYAVATVNGTAALHTALQLIGVQPGDEVITQPLSFVATANSITYCGANPVFVDVNKDTLGLDANALEDHLVNQCVIDSKTCRNRNTGKRVAACVPVHTFGHPCEIDSILEICQRYNIPLVEDSAESLGSLYKDKHTGTYGTCGVYSFNGNKTVTCGGGGAIVTNNARFAKRAKHLTTTAKVAHAYEYIHDAVGYNYRLPNINAAMACAQLEKLDYFIERKRELAGTYERFFRQEGISFVREASQAHSNYWLNTILMPNRKARDEFLAASNNSGVMTRPAWRLINSLDMYRHCQTGLLGNAEWLADRIVNIPSSVR